MGWFWASDRRMPAITTFHVETQVFAPPPGCPMHAIQGSKDSKSSPSKSSTAAPSSCPVISNRDHLSNPSNAAPSSCPVASNNGLTPKSQKDSNESSSKLNPLNYMPSFLSQETSSKQTRSLPTSRVTSTIPRGDQDSFWEYPSPQQMYNAMLRKGYDDTPEDAVESMVGVHNFLNEGAWNEIEGWESNFSQGLLRGWKHCSRGEEWCNNKRSLLESFGPATPTGEMIRKMFFGEAGPPKLMRFMGRPGDMTPKARMISYCAQISPDKFGEPPFDRHDWYVRRALPGGKSKEIRYVIDYYAGPPEPTGEPVFYLDVRPAIDTPTAACERLIRWGGDVWHRVFPQVTRPQDSQVEVK